MATGIHNDSEGAEEGNFQGLGTPSPAKIVEHGTIAGVGEAEGQDRGFTGSQIPLANLGRNRHVVDDFKARERRDGSGKPIFALLDLQLLEDSLRDQDLLGERGEEIEARDPAEQDQR